MMDMNLVKELEEKLGLPEITDAENEKKLDSARRRRCDALERWADGGEIERAFERHYGDFEFYGTPVPKSVRVAAVAEGKKIKAVISDRAQGIREYFVRTRELMLSCLSTGCEAWRKAGYDHEEYTELALGEEWIRMPYAIYKKHFEQCSKCDYDADTKTISVRLNRLEKAVYEEIAGIKQKLQQVEKKEDLDRV